MEAPNPSQITSPLNSLNRPRVGRVVTSYGHWNWIAQWLDDPALHQPFVTWVFVNDKPDDPAPPEVKTKIAKLGTLIELPVNAGRCCARNLGVAQVAHCEWIDIVDGDDLPLPFAHDIGAGWDDADMVYFSVLHHTASEPGKVEHQPNLNWSPPHLNRLMEAVIGNVDCRPAAVLWRSQFFQRLGGFDGRADYVEDFNLCIRARLAKARIAKTTEAKVNYQNGTDGRYSPPIRSVASLHNWQLAQALVSGKELVQVEDQIRIYRRSILWAGMRETELSGIGLLEKLIECVKWLIGRHRAARAKRS